jgi:SET domain-containing protein
MFKSLVTKEKQIKTLLEIPSHPSPNGYLKKTIINNSKKRLMRTYEEETLIHCWEYKLVQPLQRPVWKLFKL